MAALSVHKFIGGKYRLNFCSNAIFFKFFLNFLYESTNNKRWKDLSDLVLKSIMKYFVIEDKGFTYLADNLKAEKNVSVAKAMQDDIIGAQTVLQ